MTLCAGGEPAPNDLRRSAAMDCRFVNARMAAEPDVSDESA